MKKELLTKALALAMILMAQVGGVKAQGATETYDFGSWNNTKNVKTLTLNTSEALTSTSETKVYSCSTFVGSDDTNHNLNSRFAFAVADADLEKEVPYGWTKLESYQGLHLKGSGKIVSIQGLSIGDVVIIEHSVATSESDGTDQLFIKSKNVSYDTNSGTKLITTASSSKKMAEQLVSGTEYTIVSGNTFDFSYSASSEYYIKKVTIKTVGTNGIHIGSTGYATFSSQSAVSFAGTGVKVYWASDCTDGKVTFTEIADGQVPVNVGVLLKATPGNYTYATGTSTIKYNDNLLKNIKDDKTKVKEPETTDGKTTTRYLLGNKGGQVGFYKVDTQRTGLGGKAYLELVTDGAASAREDISMFFGDETTGINTLEGNSTVNGRVYNLNGQLVEAPAKGLYIVNGKKVIIK